MEKEQVAAALDEVGTLLELQGENAFKCNAYHAAARTLDQLETSLDDAIQSGQLAELRGIGERMQEHIVELHRTGQLAQLDDLRKKTPPGLLQMLRIQGLGPKKVKALYEELKIDDLEKLKAACDADQVAHLKGFGAKTQHKILEGLDFLGKMGQRVRIDEALPLAESLLADLRQAPGIIRMELGGSLRRRKETIADIDILVSSDHPGPIMKHFVGLPGVQQVIGQGETKSTVTYSGGRGILMNADLRIVTDEQFPFALHYFTGNKDHNIAMRQRAIDRDLKLNEYGLTRVVSRSGDRDTTERVVSRSGDRDTTESRSGDRDTTSVVARSPDRDTTSVVARSHDRDTTSVVARSHDRDTTSVVARSHDRDTTSVVARSHDRDTSEVACKDEADLFRALGVDYIPPELRENTGEIEAAERHHLPKLVEAEQIHGVFHCHTDASDGNATLEEMAQAARDLGLKYLGIGDHSQSLTVANGLTPKRVAQQQYRIDALNKKLKGFHLFKGTECDILADGRLDFDDDVLASFDYVVASVHSHFGQSREDMTARIIRAISNPHVTMLGHATGRLLLRREGYQVDLEAVLQAAAKHGTMIEINAHPQRLDLDWVHCKRAKALGIKLVINPDAHSTHDVGLYTYGVDVARRGWLEKSDVFNTLTLAQVTKALAARNKG